MSKLHSRFYGLSVAVVACLLFSAPASAGGWYHAAEKSAARRIVAEGFNPMKFKAEARFGKGLYLSKRPSTAMAEKGSRSSLIKLKERMPVGNKSIDLRNPTKGKLRSFLGETYDFRGAVKKKIIGPKAGAQVGKVIGDERKMLLYRSSKNGGTNLFIPKKTYHDFPNVVRPQKIIEQ